MKTRFFAMSLLVALLMARSVYPQHQYYLPQVANGNYGDGTFRTTFILFNNTNASAAATLKLSDGNGNPLTLTIPGMGTFNLFTFNLESGALRIVQTDGAGSLVTGTAVVNATAPIGVSGIFTVYDRKDNFLSEAGVGSSQLLTDFIMPVEATGTSYAGLALVNSTVTSTSVTYALQNAQGTEVGRKTPALGGNAQFVHFITDPELFPGTSDFRGTLVVQSPVPLAALSLRQNSSPLSYTSLPVVPRSSAKTSMNLAHVANGSFGNGSFRTSFLIFNPAARTASVVLGLTQNDGTPLRVTIPGQGTNSTFNVQLPANGSLVLQTDGSGTLTSGSATITSDAPVGALGHIYRLRFPGAVQHRGRRRGCAGPDRLHAPGGQHRVFRNRRGLLQSRQFSRHGGAQASGCPRRRRAHRGHDPSASARPHGAVCRAAFSGISNFRGSLAVSAPGGVAALTLRQYNDAARLRYTTLPVVSGTAAGKASAPALLTQSKTVSNVSTDVANVYANLPLAFRLSGTVSGAGVAGSIAATSGDTSFAGAVDPASGRYTIPVPAGNFTLKVCCQTVPTAAGLKKTYTDPSPVQVSGDTTRDVTLPQTTAFRVSGTVSGLSGINVFGPAIVFTSTDYTTEGVFAIGGDGTYQGALPQGTYRVSVTGTVAAGSGPGANLAIDLGIFGVSADTSASFDMPPTARFSGTVNINGMPLKPGATVAVTDTVVPQPLPSMLTFLPGTSISSIDIATRQYRTILADAREYTLQLTTPVVHGGLTDGAGIFTIPGLVAVAGDTTANLDINAPTEFATITGLVLDALGRRVAGVTVTARSQGLPSAPDLTYVGTALTDALGGYAVNGACRQHIRDYLYSPASDALAATSEPGPARRRGLVLIHTEP